MPQDQMDVTATCRSMILAETEALHRRVSWLGTFQGFLFAGLAFAWKETDAARLVPVFALLGLATSVLVLISFTGPVLAIQRIRKHWKTHTPADYDGLGIFGWFPENASWSIWITPENLLPLAFAMAWVAILVLGW